MSSRRREETEEAMSRVLAAAHDRRVAARLIDMAPDPAEIRARTIERMPAEQYRRWYALPDEQRFAELLALEAVERQRHEGDTRAVARSSIDDRILYRWSCSCGVRARGDYFVAEEARRDWRVHSGLEAAPVAEERECGWEGCQTGPYTTRGIFQVNPRLPNQRYCSKACREADRDARPAARPRRRLESTE